jgi:tRNA pseudouridine13 synthase
VTASAHEPPRAISVPPIGGALGPDLDDFVVDEVPAFSPSGGGAHLWVQLEKRGWTTPDAIRAIARAAGVPEREVGSAGMKDKHAVTRQWLSLPSATDPGAWQLPEGLMLIAQTRHDKKLRTGQQKGNHFRIRLVGIEPESLERAQEICAELLTRGLPNYFGAQRFGRGGDNVPRAFEWLARGAPMQGKRARFYSKLYASVIQSEVFNRYLTLRSELGLDRLLAGEVVRLEGSASLFVVEDPARELPRLSAGDIHLSGPLPGPKTRAAERDALALERRILDELALDEALLATLARHAPGTRRDLVVIPAELSCRPLENRRLELEFFLPSGSYATELVRQLTGEPLLSRGPWRAPG